jgi:hypothetical protein
MTTLAQIKSAAAAAQKQIPTQFFNFPSGKSSWFIQDAYMKEERIVFVLTSGPIKGYLSLNLGKEEEYKDFNWTPAHHILWGLWQHNTKVLEAFNWKDVITIKDGAPIQNFNEQLKVNCVKLKPLLLGVMINVTTKASKNGKHTNVIGVEAESTV